MRILAGSCGFAYRRPREIIHERRLRDVTAPVRALHLAAAELDDAARRPQGGALPPRWP